MCFLGLFWNDSQNIMAVAFEVLLFIERLQLLNVKYLKKWPGTEIFLTFVAFHCFFLKLPQSSFVEEHK